MKRSLSFPCAAAALLAALAAAPAASAGTITSPGTYSLTSSATHVWGAPYFTDDVATGESPFGIVDQLNLVHWLEYDTDPIDLPRGRYAISFRLKKLPITASGIAFDLHSSVTLNGETLQVTLPAAAQTINTWVDTPALVLDVGDETTPFSVFFGNIDTSGFIAKADYWFDSFTITPVSYVVSATDIPHVHGIPYWTDDVPSTESAFGKYDHLIGGTGLTWLEYYATVTLPAGTYSATMRYRPGTLGYIKQPLFMWCTGLPSAFTTVTPDTVQPTGQWAESVPMVFSLTSTTTFFVEFGNTDGSVTKDDYDFDRLVVTPVAADHVTLVANRQPYIGAPFDLGYFAPGAPGKIAFVGYALGFSPGIPLGDGRVLGLNPDVLFNVSLSPTNGVFLNSIAFIGADGSLPAAPMVALPYTPQLANLKIYACAVSIDLNVPTYVVGKSSTLLLDLLP